MIPICDKFITTSEFNICSETIFDERLKQTNLPTKSDFDSALQCANKNDEKLEKLQTFNLGNFLDENYFTDDGLQNNLTFQLIFKYFTTKTNGYHILEWESNRL